MARIDDIRARSAAISGVAASASLTSKRRPKRPVDDQERGRHALRLEEPPPRQALPTGEPVACFRPASTSRCFSVCGTGIYSSLDTICVGTGDGKRRCLGRLQVPQLLVRKKFHLLLRLDLRNHPWPLNTTRIAIVAAASMPTAQVSTLIFPVMRADFTSQNSDSTSQRSDLLRPPKAAFHVVKLEPSM